MRLWDLETGKPTKEIAWVDDSSALLASTKAGELIGVCRGREGGSQAVNPLSGKMLGEWRKKERDAAHAISPDSRFVASKERDREKGGEPLTIRLVETGEVVCRLPFDSGSPLSAVTFAPDGRMIAVGGIGYMADGSTTIYVFDITTGKELRTIRGHTGAVSVLAFSPDGKRLATGSTDTTVLIWDLKP